ncbi:MAG: hypothetical protein MR425_05890 [Lachnospiraceae bacterium]|nr:hypothetical protein [Lachnospiraceae bacterium]
MDDPRYATGFVKKVYTYMDNGFFPGENLIITYETMNHPIATQHIQTLIETI